MLSEPIRTVALTVSSAMHYEPDPFWAVVVDMPVVVLISEPQEFDAGSRRRPEIYEGAQLGSQVMLDVADCCVVPRQTW